MKYSKNQQIKLINALAKEAVNKKQLNAEIYNNLKILENDTQKNKEAKYSALYAQLNLTMPNFILVNMLNMVRFQTYLWMQGDLLANSKFGFWKSNKGNGEYVIVEDMIEATARTGNPTDDIANITPAPAVETQLLMFSENKAADIPKNAEIEKWATLEGATGWINERLQLLKSALDFPLSTYLKEKINAYAGYQNILIDDTGLSNDEKQTALQKAIGQVILTITNDYRNVFNESADGTLPNFTYKLNLKDIGLIFDTAAEINNEIDYLRKLYKNFDGATNNYPKDWGVGEIINMDLDDEVGEVVLLPKQKLLWNAQYGSGTTPLWYSLQELITEYVFYGHVFIKSAPSVNFSFGTAPLPEMLEAELNTSTNQFILKLKRSIEKKIKSLLYSIESIKKMKELIGFKEFKRKQNEAINALQNELKLIAINKGTEKAPNYKVNIDYLKEILKNTITLKGTDLINKKENNNVNLDKLGEIINLKIENLELKLINANKEQKEILEQELKELKEANKKTEGK